MGRGAFIHHVMASVVRLAKMRGRSYEQGLDLFKVTVMAIAQSELEARLKAAFPEAKISIEDLAGDGDHYRARIESEVFRGLTRVKQHQLVNKALADLLSGPLHALALETSVPDVA